jgi:hypothetical protein
MSNELTSNEIFEIRDAMANLAKDINNYLVGNQDTIPAVVSRDLEDLACSIRKYVSDLTDVGIGSLLTDLKNPSEKINKAIQRLQYAFFKITDFNNFLSKLGGIVNIFGIIARGAISGIASIDLDSAFQSLNDLLAEAKANFQYCSIPQTVERIFTPDVDLKRQELILVFGNKWLNGTILHYYFFDEGSWKGSEAEKNVVREAFKIWKSVGIGLEFKEVTSRSEAEIRIGFLKGDGSWSMGLGREILNNGINHRTMNFGWDITRYPREIDTAIHEIGHSLGFPHEHQNPNAGIVWDEEKVYAELAKSPNEWSRERTFHNIIRKLDPREVEGSTWDPKSVMHYPFGPDLIKAPPEFVAGIQPSGGLSAKDKEYVRKFYPLLPNQEIELIPFVSIPLELRADHQQNFKIVPEATREYNFATFGASDSVLGIFENIDSEPRYVQADDDSGEERNATLRVKLFAGRPYILRVRVYHQRDEKVAVMMW